MTVPGVITRLDKAVGFVRRLDGDVEFMFDRRAVEGVAFETLHLGQRVEFTEGATTIRGPRARSVTPTRAAGL